MRDIWMSSIVTYTVAIWATSDTLKMEIKTGSVVWYMVTGSARMPDPIMVATEVRAVMKSTCHSE